MTARTQFRIVSVLEGISYLVLMIAMPLKYAAGEPAAVAIAGRIHGGLFVVFGLALARVASRDQWPGRATLTALVAACIPLGAFWLERKLRVNWPLAAGS
ncbi:MAG: DUF3817 domain-containing protein [Deltaproteobacteria bacterium]|nr:DUF3817 domain-containing protein [Deltaproteobacteria bacterium]